MCVIMGFLFGVLLVCCCVFGLCNAEDNLKVLDCQKKRLPGTLTNDGLWGRE